MLDTIDVHVPTPVRSETDPFLPPALGRLDEPLAAMAGDHLNRWDVDRGAAERLGGNALVALAHLVTAQDGLTGGDNENG